MVTRYRYIDELPTHQGALLQVSSEIRGRLAGGWQAEVGDLFFRLLPAGSITGAPKKKTMEIIAEAVSFGSSNIRLRASGNVASIVPFIG